MYKGKEGTEDLLQADYLLEIEKFEKKIMNATWRQLCWAKSFTEPECNANAFMSALSFLGDK